MSAIPLQWQRFDPWLGHIPGQVPNVAYGVVFNGDDDGSTDYLTGMEVTDFADVPGALSRLRLPGERYAVFRHPGHVSEIRSVWRAIWTEWVPGCLGKLRDAPFFERYPETFDPKTGAGGFETWLPVAGGSAPDPSRQACSSASSVVTRSSRRRPCGVARRRCGSSATRPSSTIRRTVG
jgi:AraC family transcriptional regulator